MILKHKKSKFLYNDGNVRVWKADHSDYDYVMYLCKKFRNHEFFYVPDNTMKDEIRKGNIIAFDFNVLEAGYIWVTFNKNGKSRVNQLAVDPELWRNKVGSIVTNIYERMANDLGMWGCYLSCNTNTPGDKFWPTQGWTPIIKKEAGKGRGGHNIIWAKLLENSKFKMFEVRVEDIKSSDSYKFQSSITAAVVNKKNKKLEPELQFDFFGAKKNE